MKNGPKVTIEKTGARGAWRWHYAVDWPQGNDVWYGLGGWTYTKKDAKKAARSLLKSNLFGVEK